VISSAVSCCDPVAFEIVVGFRLARGIELFCGFGPAVGEAFGLGNLLVCEPFGPLSCCSQIDHLSHAMPSEVTS
jgi:hypothetical protein